MYVTKVPLGQYPLYNPFSYHYCYEYGIYVMDGLCKCDTTRPQPCHLSSRKTHSLGAAIIYHAHPSLLQYTWHVADRMFPKFHSLFQMQDSEKHMHLHLD